MPQLTYDAHPSARAAPSRLVLHLLSPTPLLPLLLPPRVSPSLTHLTAHPPSLLTHLSTTQFMPPPPSTPAPAFWRVFAPLAARTWEVERLVYGAGDEGAGSGWNETVVEVLLRGPGAGVGEGKRRGAERVLEGWVSGKGPCELAQLDSLKKIWTRKASDEVRPLTFPLAFNISGIATDNLCRALFVSRPSATPPKISPSVSISRQSSSSPARVSPSRMLTTVS